MAKITQNTPKILSIISTIFQKSKTILYRFYKFSTRMIMTRPERSFFSLIGVLFILIIIGNIIGRPPAKKTAAPPVKPVRVFSIGASPKMKVLGKIEKSGATKIIAQSAGVVQAIYTSPGESISRGKTLLALSTNAQGGTIPSVSRQLAQTNYTFTKDNYDTQLDLINKQREVAKLVNTQTSDLRNISTESIQNTKSLITVNEDLLKNLDSQLQYLVATDVGGCNTALIIQTKQGISGIMGGISSLRTALNNTEYQVDPNNPPAKLADLQRDLTLKQLDIQEKSLALNREVSRLNLLIAQISESLMYPASPISGTVERLYVQVGQTVSPGMLLASITGDVNTATAVVSLPSEVTQQLSRIESSILWISGKAVETIPMYISQEPTEGLMNSVLFSIPDTYSNQMVNGSSITIEIPVGKIGANSIIPYIPLDTVYQTQNNAYVYLVNPTKNGAYEAKSREIKLGNVYGEYVEVTSGLKDQDQIIEDRSVVDGDAIKFQ